MLLVTLKFLQGVNMNHCELSDLYFRIGVAESVWNKANFEANIALKVAEEANAKSSSAGCVAIQAYDALWELKKIAKFQEINNPILNKQLSNKSQVDYDDPTEKQDKIDSDCDVNPYF